MKQRIMLAFCLVQLLLLVPASVCSEVCPPWTLPSSNTSNQCVCGSDLGGVVQCNSKTLEVSVLFCYCMTYNDHINMTLVGQCLPRCDFLDTTTCRTHNRVHANTSELINLKLCGEFNRDGQLCGNCMKGYGPPVYSYSFTCVECKKSDFALNLIRYVAAAFLPLTLFYLIVIIFKVKVTKPSGSMMVYVLTCQLLSIPLIVRYLSTRENNIHTNIVTAFFAVWNLDILRSVYPPFCIHPDMSTLQALALDYLLGVYPLVLILLTYLAVWLHDRYSLVVRLWRPGYTLCMCIRRQWDIRGSLIQAFATFLVLSYVKILNVSYDLLTPVTLLTTEGTSIENNYLYSAGDVVYFGKEHLPYAILGIVMLTFFNILPIILLLLYPCRCFQKCLSCSHLNTPALHIFVDTFQGCYRHKPRDCRYFAPLFLFVRFLQLLIFASFSDMISVVISGLYMITLALIMLILRPYKVNKHNTIGTVIFLFYACTFMLSIGNVYSYPFEYRTLIHRIFKASVSVPPLILVIFGVGVAVRKVLPARLLSKFRERVRRVFKNRLPYINPTCTLTDTGEQFPRLVEHETECTSLLK